MSKILFILICFEVIVSSCKPNVNNIKNPTNKIAVDTVCYSTSYCENNYKLLDSMRMVLVLLNDSDAVWKNGRRYLFKGKKYDFAIGLYNVKSEYTSLFKLNFPSCEIHDIDTTSLRFSINTPLEKDSIQYDYSINYPYLLIKGNEVNEVHSGLINSGKMFFME